VSGASATRRDRLRAVVDAGKALDAALGALQDDDIPPDRMLALGDHLSSVGALLWVRACANGAAPPIELDEEEERP
jgi:hypothetical protein